MVHRRVNEMSESVGCRKCSFKSRVALDAVQGLKTMGTLVFIAMPNISEGHRPQYAPLCSGLLYPDFRDRSHLLMTEISPESGPKKVPTVVP